jgi:hypothetical protein
MVRDSRFFALPKAYQNFRKNFDIISSYEGVRGEDGNYSGLALALFRKTTAVPAPVSSVFMIVYISRLDFQKRRRYSES